MSSRYRVEFELVGNAGNIEATLNRLNNGISRVGSTTRSTTNEMGLWQRQMMAMSTTARYALAGGVVFGVTAAVGALAQFERKMGQIMAIMGDIGTTGGFNQAKKDIGSLSQYALDASIRLNTGVESIQDSLQTFYSSFDVAGGEKGVKQAQEFTDVITKLGTVAEATNFDMLANGVIGFSNALGRGRPDIQKYANEISRFVAVSVGIRGDVLAQGIGNLGATANLGAFTPEQSLAYLATAAQGGGSPAVTLRGFSQLQRTILHPRTPEQIAAYQSVGLPTDATSLSRLGGSRVLQRMLAGVRRQGGLSAHAISEEAIGEATDAASSGVRGGGAGTAFNLFGRAESLRAFATIYSQQGREKDFDYFLKQITEAGKNMDTLNAQFRAFMSQSTLSNVSNAFHAFSISAVRALDPLLHPIAGVITGGLAAATHHPRVTMGVEGALFTALIARTASRFIPGGFGKLLGRFGRGATGLAGGAAGAALTGEAAANLLGGGHTDGSRSNPFWVIIHPASAMIGGTAGAATTTAGPGGESKLFSRAFNVLKRNPGLVARVAVGAGAAATAAAILAAGGSEGSSGAQHDAAGNQIVNYGRMRSHGYSFSQVGVSDNAMASAIIAAMSYAERLRGLNRDNISKIVLDGEAKADLTVTLVDAQGHPVRVEEKKGVPVKLWSANNAPQHRGKSKDIRKGR